MNHWHIVCMSFVSSHYAELAYLVYHCQQEQWIVLNMVHCHEFCHNDSLDSYLLCLL